MTVYDGIQIYFFSLWESKFPSSFAKNAKEDGTLECSLSWGDLDSAAGRPTALRYRWLRSMFSRSGGIRHGGPHGVDPSCVIKAGAYDSSANTRQGLLDRAAADKLDVLANHFPFPGMGRVKCQGHAWKWEAAN